MRKILGIAIVILLGVATYLIASNLNTKENSSTTSQEQDVRPSQKEINQEIEGQSEQTEVTLNEGDRTDYVIYIDEERYQMEKGQEKDVITTREPMPDHYPPVSLDIIQVEDQSPEETIESLEADLLKDFPDLDAIEEVTEPVQGYLLHGVDGSDATSKVVHAYVVSNEAGGSFILQENYFLEAAEGHGARFYHMLESFEVEK